MNRKAIIALFLLCATLVISAVAVTKTFSVDPTGCTNCGLCVKSCPVEAITTVTEGSKSFAVIDPSKCTGCGICADNCPMETISEVSK